MTSPTAPRMKITYATLRADNEELHAAYEAGLERAKARLGAHHRNFVGGRERDGEGTFEVRSPIDREIVVGTFARGTRQDVHDAVAAARAAQPAWAATPWHERLAILRRAADLISERQMEYAGLMAIEVGKNRLEALGEVEEAADLIRYYAKTWEDNDGYDHPMDNLGDAAVHTRSILRPHGVFAVISPFNFPMALAGGPTSAALMTGNTVVFKPASAGAMSGVALIEAYRDAGLPDGVVNLVMGPGDTVGAELRENAGIDGIVFTGSYEVGFDLFRTFSTRYPRPCIVEMGGKNPAIVSRRRGPRGGGRGHHALGLRLRRARSAPPTAASTSSGRCTTSWCGCSSRRPRRSPSATRSSGSTGSVRSSTGARSIGTRRAVAEARRDGTVFTGGEHLTDGDLDRGFYVEPTVVGNLPASHRLFQDELFAPLTAVAAVDSLDEAIRLSNESLYGLTAGVYSEDPAEVEKFLTEIHAGVLYVNRRAGATTGAWPGVQAFGGWKGSGSTGKAGLSMYYVAQFLREQSHTVVD